MTTPKKQRPDNQPRTLSWYFLAICRKIASLFYIKKNHMLIAHEEDEHGIIRIYEIGDYRFLEFGMRVEQSCVAMSDPSWLEYDYTRAMLMGALVHPAPKTALFLGLGAGTLTTACLKHLPLSKVTAVELRPAVVKLAKEHLALPQDPRLTIEIGDALKLLEEQPPMDLIFLDLYTDVGPSDGHAGWSFLGDCRNKLNDNGWLIINQWAAKDGTALEEPMLKVRFQHHYWECSVESGNIVLFIPSNKNQLLDFTFLEEQIAWVEPMLGYSLHSLLRNTKLTAQ